MVDEMTQQAKNASGRVRHVRSSDKQVFRMTDGRTFLQFPPLAEHGVDLTASRTICLLQCSYACYISYVILFAAYPQVHGNGREGARQRGWRPPFIFDRITSEERGSLDPVTRCILGTEERRN